MNNPKGMAVQSYHPLGSRKFLLHRLLIGREHPGGGVRSIAISGTWYRFAGVCALRTTGPGICAGLAPPHAGEGTRGGTETVSHALASALAEDPETMVARPRPGGGGRSRLA